MAKAESTTESTEFRHPGGHSVPSGKQELAVIVLFIKSILG